MELHQIENLSFAELKSQQAAIVAAAAEATLDTLAVRYVQARTDAKQRDEKLAEQATTLAALTEGVNAMTGKNRELAAEVARLLELVKQREAELHDVKQASLTQLAKLAQEHAEVKQLLADESNRANRAVSLAHKRRGVLAELMQKVSPLLAEEA